MGCSASSPPPPQNRAATSRHVEHPYHRRDDDNNHFTNRHEDNTHSDTKPYDNNRNDGINNDTNYNTNTGHDEKHDTNESKPEETNRDTHYNNDTREETGNYADDHNENAGNSDDYVKPKSPVEEPKPLVEEPRSPTPKPPTPKPPTPKPPMPEPNADDNDEDETPFDDTEITDSEGYKRTAMGLMSKEVDYRNRFVDDEPDERPQGCGPDNPYEDTDFPLEIAIVQDNNGLEWKRPKDFVSDPKLFTDGSTRFDIGQGSAGTCWFLSTVANIAENDQMLKQVIPDSAYLIDDPDRYDGIFHARFFRFGKWEDVYIDDYLPCIYNTMLWGAKSATDENEMWVALLEKAFARCYGSYDAIYGGQPGDAYLLLTSGIGERIELDDHADKASTIYSRIKNALNSGCQVSCVVPDEYDKHQGLVGGHAYSLVGVTQVGRTKLIRVRNPWGHGEWTGRWSDGSSEWQSIPDNSVTAPNKDDGEFYVCLEDFMDFFSQTTICSLTPDFDCDGSSDALKCVLSIFGEWNGPTAAGFHKLLQNPRFCFTLTDEGTMEDGCVPFVVQIIQQSEKRKTDNISMRCDVFRVLGDKIRPEGRTIALEIQGKKTNVYTPELQSSFRHRLKPGRYMIIPSTVDEGQEKAFLLRLFTSAPVQNVKEITPDVNLVSCESETTIDIKGKGHALTFEKALFGEFISGKNAGGQVSYRDSYHKNPQYLITIPNTGDEVPLVVHIMQTNAEPQYPVGFRMFQLDDGAQMPVDIRYLYDHYEGSPTHLEGSQSKFMISWDVDVRYMLPPGRYIALIHLDQPDTEKLYTVVFKSTAHIGIKGYQTG